MGHRGQRRFPLRHLSQPLTFGGVVTTLSVVGYIAVLVWWPWPWAYPEPTYGVTDQKDAFAAQMAFGQVYTSFVAVFLASTLGFFAIQEFAEARERPALRLAFHDQGADELSLLMAGNQTDPPLFSIAIYNDGPVVAVWYMVEIRLPFLNPAWRLEYLIAQPPEPSGRAMRYAPVHVVSGTRDDNWRLFWDAAAQEHGITFLSNGAVAAYPGFPLVLCQIALTSDTLRDTEGYYSCAYRIGYERASPQAGTLQLRLRRQTSS